MVKKSEKIWLDGEFVDWDAANVHILTHTLHYGLGVYEGIRTYKLDNEGSAVFKLQEHIERMFDSCRLIKLSIPFSKKQLNDNILSLLKINKLSEGYIRPLVFVGNGAMGLYAIDNPTRVAIITWEWGTYLGKEALEKGIKTKISSLRRNSMSSTLNKGKVVGHYVNNILAKRDAMMNGYDEAIMLDEFGYVAEGSGENIFLVKNGIVKTPPYSSPVLGGITRDTAISLMRDHGITVKEQNFGRDELYLADEVFFSGTAAEITPIQSVDGYTIGTGSRGEITKKIQNLFFDVVRGKITVYNKWLTKYVI